MCSMEDTKSQRLKFKIDLKKLVATFHGSISTILTIIYLFFFGITFTNRNYIKKLCFFIMIKIQLKF